MFRSFMPDALEEARAAMARGEVPVGAVISDPQTGRIIARAGNETRATCDPTAHAEILAIRRACATLGQDRLPGLHLTVTLEPCPMCASAIAQARLARVTYGAADEKSGGVDNGPRIFTHPQSHHKPDVLAGIDEATCAALLKDFFAHKR